MPIEIRRTIVTHAADGDVVEMHISDAPPEDEPAAFSLVLYAKIPTFEAPLLAHVQRAALAQAQDEITPIFQALAKEITEVGNRPLDPTPKRLSKFRRPLT